MNSLSRVVLAATAVSVAALWSLQAHAAPEADFSLEKVVMVLCTVNQMGGAGTLDDPYTCLCPTVGHRVVGGGAMCRSTDHISISAPDTGETATVTGRQGWVAACFDGSGKSVPIFVMRVICLAP